MTGFPRRFDERAKEKIGKPPLLFPCHITIKNHRPVIAGFPCIDVGSSRHNAPEQLERAMLKKNYPAERGLRGIRLYADELVLCQS